MDKLKMETPNLTAQNIDRIAELFPGVITEKRNENGKLIRAVNFELLKQQLSSEVLAGDEAYEFTWVGKKASIVEANKPIRKTLRPCKEESKDWDTTENLYIEGDNLDVLKLLQESYLGKVKMIYIDPPYNTGHDFIYNDQFEMDEEEYNQQIGLFDEDQNKNFRENNESNPRFHSDWCSMMYSRLLLARNIMARDGVIAISIGYQEVNNLMQICQQVFGNMQIMGITVQTSGGKPSGCFNITHEYLVFIAPIDFIAVPSEADMKEYSSPYHGMNLASFNQSERPNQAYPIFVDTQGRIIGCGKSLQERLVQGIYTGTPEEFIFDFNEAPEGAVAIWPVTSKGDPCVWRLIPSRLMSDWQKGYIKVVPQNSDSSENKFAVQFLSAGIISKIENGELETYRISDDDSIPTIDVKDYKTSGVSIATIWTDKQYYTTKGGNEIRELFIQKYFSYPKPVDLISNIVRRATNIDSIILDFFSGSSTTAHAVMQLNAEDGGHRKFIMVQLPEPCDEKSEAYKAGYKNICEIGKERIRRAGAKIKSEAGLMAQTLDTGFRVFKLDETNMKDVFYSAEEYTQARLDDMISNIKEDRTDLDLLYGCLLEWGLPLSLPHVTETIEGCNVHTVNGGDLIACFDENIPESVIKKIAERKPLRVVFRDSSFASSPEKINVTEIFKLMAPGTSVRVI